MTVQQPVPRDDRRTERRDDRARPRLSQREAARVANRAAWRQAALGSLLFLVLGFAFPPVLLLIVAVVAVTLLQNGRRERAAADGTFTPESQRRRAWFLIAVVGVLGGTWLLLHTIAITGDVAPGALYLGSLGLVGGVGSLVWMHKHPVQVPDED